MKNILILTEAFPPVLNSSSKLIDELCLGLVSQKIAVTVLTESNSLMSKEIDYKDGIKLKLIPNILSKKKGFLIRGLREILLPIIFSYYGRKIIKEKKIDEIYRRTGDDATKLVNEYNKLKGKESGAKVALEKKIRSLPEYQDFFKSREKLKKLLFNCSSL